MVVLCPVTGLVNPGSGDEEDKKKEVDAVVFGEDRERARPKVAL